MRTLSNMTEKWRVLQYTRPATPDKQFARRVWRYQRGNQNPYIEEQTTQWPKEKVQKDKQRSTKHTYKTKDWVTRTPLKSVGELRCFGRASSSCSTSDNRSVNLVTNPVISHLQHFLLSNNDKKARIVIPFTFKFCTITRKAVCWINYSYKNILAYSISKRDCYVKTNKNVEIKFSAHDAFLE
jgi:hypothetical protein